LRDAFTLISSGQALGDAVGSLKALAGAIVAAQHANELQVAELRRLIGQCQADASLLHDIAIQLPEQAIAALFVFDSAMGLLLFQRFCEVSRGQGWPFEYTDKIGGACLRFSQASNRDEVKALAIATALEVGVSHSRWGVMETAARLIGRIDDNDGAAAVRRAIADMTDRLVDIEGRLEGKKLHPIIRELLESGKKAQAQPRL
jgi:hypothetical protein